MDEKTTRETTISEAKRAAMNELYSAGVAMRKAQKDYFRLRTQENLYTAKDSEDRFDRALRACMNIGKPFQPTLI